MHLLYSHRSPLSNSPAIKMHQFWASPMAQMVKDLCLQCGRPRFDPWVRRSSGGGNATPLQSSFLGNPVDGVAWWATVHGVARNQTQLNTQHALSFQLVELSGGS